MLVRQRNRCSALCLSSTVEECMDGFYALQIGQMQILVRRENCRSSSCLFSTVEHQCMNGLASHQMGHLQKFVGQKNSFSSQLEMCLAGLPGAANMNVPPVAPNNSETGSSGIVDGDNDDDNVEENDDEVEDEGEEGGEEEEEEEEEEEDDGGEVIDNGGDDGAAYLEVVRVFPDRNTRFVRNLNNFEQIGSSEALTAQVRHIMQEFGFFDGHPTPDGYNLEFYNNFDINDDGGYVYHVVDIMGITWDQVLQSNLEGVFAHDDFPSSSEGSN